jgi:predicted exporter
MKRAHGLVLSAALSSWFVLAAFVVSRWSVSTDITAFLPDAGKGEQLELSRLLADSPLSRTMVITVGAKEPETARAAGISLEAALRNDPSVSGAIEQLRGGPPQGLDRAMYELYHPRRLGFLASSPEEARALLQPEALRKAARVLRGQLEKPISPLLARLAPSDPLLILPGLFERVEGAQGSELTLDDGRFMSRDGKHAVLMLTTKASAFDSAHQAPLLAAIARAFARIDRAHRGGLTMEQSGVNRFAVRSERTIQEDVQRVSVLSVVGLALLLSLLFRSARLLVLAAIPVSTGVLAGVAACLAVLGRVHGVTLAFGASLLGVAIDYVVHLYCHHAVAPDPSGPHGTLRAIRSALITGAGTTVIGFAALLAAGLGGLGEVALFSSIGISVALLVTLYVLPALLPARVEPVELRARLVAALSHSLARLRMRRRTLWFMPAAALALSIFGLARVDLDVDFMSMERLDPALVAEDARVRARVARFDGQRFALAIGDDEDAALRANEELARALDRARAEGVLGGYRSVSSLLPSPSTQRAVADVVRAEPHLDERIAAAFAEEGFRSEAFAPFFETLRGPAAEPLGFDLLQASPLRDLVSPFRLEVGGRVAFVSFLRDVRDPAALRSALSRIEGAHFVAQAEQMRETHARYQRRTLFTLALGLLAVLAVLALRYRNWRQTIAAFVPSVLAAGVTVAALNLTGHGLNLVVLMALLMVVSMGVDYGVFLVDADASNEPEKYEAAALLSISVAALTTVLGFGLLAASRHPLLFSIGLTASAGMLGSVVLAPTSLVLMEGLRRNGGRR